MLGDTSPDAQLLEKGSDVIRAEASALQALATSLDHHFARACALIFNCRRQLVVTGMGKSGLIARKISATFAATGTPSSFLHPGEAGHGDLGMICQGDILFVLSNSGHTAELQHVIAYAGRIGVPVISAGARANSPVIRSANVPLLMPRVDEACPANIAPTTSTAMQLALGDALAMTVMEMRGITKIDLQKWHPAGTIGFALTPLHEIMHGPERLPLVSADARMPEVISCMTKGCFGLAGVVDADGGLIGIITDGDLRRSFGKLTTIFARDVMTANPKTLQPDLLADEALVFLNDHAITAAFIVAEAGAGPRPPLGIIHVHDLLRRGLN